MNLTVIDAGVRMPPIQLAKTPLDPVASVRVPAETAPVQPTLVAVAPETPPVDAEPVVVTPETPLDPVASVRVPAETAPVQPTLVAVAPETPPKLYVPPQRPRKNDRN